MFVKIGENYKLCGRTYFLHEMQGISKFFFKIRAGCEKENLKYNNLTHLLFMPELTIFIKLLIFI
jgi:hypothetical protein